jgi:cysteine desulfurase/selenocysteine lyase
MTNTEPAFFDHNRVRSDTPGCSVVAHFNSAACSLPPRCVTEAIIDHLQREALHGPAGAALAAAATIHDARVAAALLINASVDEIAFLSSGSHAWGSAFAALPPFRAGDRILTSRHEWGGNLSTLQRAAERANAVVDIVPSMEDGAISLEAMQAMLDEKVRLVALTWLPANSGLINPAAAIGRLTRAAVLQ